MSVDQEKTCILCSGPASTSALTVEGIGTNVFKTPCSRCGTLLFSLEFFSEVKSRPLSFQEKANCVAENIRLNEEKLDPLWLAKGQGPFSAPSGVELRFLDVVGSRPLLHSAKKDALLLRIASRLTGSEPFARVMLGEKDVRILRMTSDEEAMHWLTDLKEDKLVSSPGFDKRVGLSNSEIRLTPEGWRRIEYLDKGQGSKDVFIAMSFNLANRSEIQGAIESACSKTGWEAFSVDQRHYVGGVTDEIVASINRSAFVVADFTENKRGVYYEAGYARGLSKTVINTVHADHVDGDPKKGMRLHFDTQHLNYLIWETPAELEEKLIQRINAVINVKLQ